ncbi:MAG: hypothetical protein ABH952_02515 [Candidatus Omnitrophota bacterium]
MNIPYCTVNNKAQVLIVVLWILCFLSLSAFSLGYRTHVELKLANYRLEDTIARAAAISIIKFIEAVILTDDNGFGALNETWSNGYNRGERENLFKNIKLSGVCLDIYYKRADAQEGFLLYGLKDEESKININSAEKPLFVSLFNNIENSLKENEIIKLADEIIKMRTKLPEGLFISAQQLLLVKGMRQDYYEKIEEYITCYGEGSINFNTASNFVLKCLGVSDELIDNIAIFRKGADGKIATADDGVFETPQAIITAFGGQLGEKITTLINQGKIGVSSTAFDAQITVTSNKSQRVKKFRCILGKTPKEDSRVFYWQG